jgi:hypothetical protein
MSISLWNWRSVQKGRAGSRRRSKQLTNNNTALDKCRPLSVSLAEGARADFKNGRLAPVRSMRRAARAAVAQTDD